MEICNACPVMLECLEDNLYEDDGIFGGKSGRQRRQIRSKIGQFRNCRLCGKSFQRHQPGQWYCSPGCRVEAKRVQGYGL